MTEVLVIGEIEPYGRGSFSVRVFGTWAEADEWMKATPLPGPGWSWSIDKLPFGKDGSGQR